MKQTKLFLRLLSLLLAMGWLTAPLDAQTQLGMDIDGEAAEDQSGYSVSVSTDGNRVAIGARINDGNGTNSGHVRVYAWDGSSWTQLGADIDGEAAEDFSGFSVSLSADGNRVAIGAPFNDDNGTNSGQVRVYAWDGSSWTQVGADIDGETAGDFSGTSVSLSADGNRVAIGAPFNDGNGTDSGQVRVYEWDGSSWTQVGADIDGEAANDRSGTSVSLSADGRRVAIGAILNDGNIVNSGHVRVYAWDGSSWTQVGADIDGEAAGDQSGTSVSLSADGNRVAVGAPLNDDNGTDSGHVRVYAWDGSSWTQVGADIDGEAAGDQSGYSVSLSADGNRVAIGAINNDDNGTLSGHVRVYEWDGSSWTQVGADIDGEAAGDRSGYSVSLSADGKRVAIGAITNDGNGSSSGHVRVYELTSSCQLAITGTTTTPVSCQGSSDGALTITATGAANINFTIDGPGGMQTNTTGIFVDLMAGNFSVTVSDADLANCSVTQTSTVSTAADTEDPVAICPDNIIESNDPGECGAEVTFNIDVSDNCPGATVEADPPSGSFFAIGTTTVTVTATDASGNTDQCTFDVMVNDTEDPVITCPADIAIECDESIDPSNTGNATATDNCDPNPMVTSSDVIIPGDCPNEFVIERTFVAVDASGNGNGNGDSGGVDQTLTGPGDFSGNETLITFEELGPTDQILTNQYVSQGVTFHSDDPNQSPHYDQVPYVGAAFPSFSGTGHLANYSTIVGFDFDQNMILRFNSPISRIGFYFTSNSGDDLTISLQCMMNGSTIGKETFTSGDGSYVFAGVESSQAFDEVILIVEPFVQSGYFQIDDLRFESLGSSCVQRITVQDTEAPMVSCSLNANPPSFNGEDNFATEDFVDVTTSDNCSTAVTVAFDPPLISCEQLQTPVAVTVTATDECGNAETCTITVVPDGLPCGFMLSEIGCQGDADYDVPTETFTLEATNCLYGNPYNNDELTYVKTELCGNGEIIAEVDDIEAFAWAGIMMRETLAQGSKKIALSRDNGFYARREARSATNGPAYPQQFPAFGKNWLRLVRNGNQFMGYVSNNGNFWQQVMVANISMDQCIYVGLFLTNKQPNQTVSADFRNVEVNQDHSGMNLQQLPATILATQPDVSVYPNPTAGLVTIDLGAFAEKDIQLDVRNSNGQVVLQRDLGRVSDQRAQLQLGHLPTGVYWLRVQVAGEAPRTERIVVQRP